MPFRYLLGLLAILFSPMIIIAQAIDNTSTYKHISAERYFRLNYENDFFSATDKYYTQGISLEIVSPALRKFPLSKLLFQPGYSFVRYGIGMEHEGYTPTNIATSAILYGDRPFASCLFLKTFVVATDSLHGQRFSTTLSTGVIGQAAFGAEMQTYIHKELNNITPHGWPNQVHNDAIVNYQADYEKQLVSSSSYFSLNACGTIRAGTLNDKAGAGLNIMAGYFDNPYKPVEVKGKNFRIYAYEHAQVNAVAYDATLQGGMFNHSSPYVLHADNMKRIVLENRFGIVLAYRKLYLEYFQSYLSSEFKTSDFHVWGGVQLAVAL